jgi:AcrR family transcriptional regulator
MVNTPWGKSEMLRGERLPPGSRKTAQTVADNQRRRLFGAMVASVAERGYENTRVADLVEISGVSMRSFYDLFPDKGACFASTIESFVETVIDAILGGPGDDGEDPRRRLRNLALLAVAQPAAARMCLVEAYVAGGPAATVIDRVLERAEAVIRQRLAGSPKWEGLPPEMVTIVVAAFVEAFRTRLIAEQPRQLPDLAEELADLLREYEPPVRPLRSAARPPLARPEELEASDHAERALRAFEVLLTEQAYAETTMEQVAKRAAMSARTLYANFSGREDLMLAAIDSAGAQVVAAVLPAYRRHPSPPEGIRAGFGALFGLLASRPNLAHLLIAAVYEGGAPAIERRAEALRPLEGLLTRAAPQRRTVGRAIAAEALLGGVLGLARRRLAESGPGSLPGLAPICTYVALGPSLGAEAATAAAVEGKSYRRTPTEIAAAWREASARPHGERVLLALTRGPLGIDAIARESGLVPEDVEQQIGRLEEDGVVESVESGERTLYQSRWPVWETEEWERYDQSERERLSVEILRSTREEIEEAVGAGTFDARTNRYLIRFPIWVDERGWQELDESLQRSLDDCFAIQARIRRRLEESDNPDEGFPARVLLVSFEMPRPEE